MAKTEFLQIRVSPEDLLKIRKAAEEDHLDTSTWARRAILQAVAKKMGPGHTDLATKKIISE
ncbi:hypothetical protein D9M71_728510 [compost metagenome]